jgi:hypothetical protein
MKKLHSFFLYMMVNCCINTNAQINLVRNSSFELASCYDNTVVGICVNDWKLPNGNGPIICAFTSNNPVGNSDWYYNRINPTPHSGNACIGLRVQTEYNKLRVEYATSELIQPLIAGKTYFYRFYVHAAYYDGDKLGLAFTKGRPKQNCRWHIIDEGQQITNSSYFSQSMGWVEKSGTFVAEDSYTWITVGCFDKNFLSFNADQYYFIDDIRVWDYCPPELLIENHVFEFKEHPYEAGVIKAGNDVGAPTTNGPVVVKNGADITFKAETEVRLEPGFEVQAGAIFNAYIAPCGRDCDFLPALNLTDNFEICHLQPISIGTNTLPDNVGFYWTAEPSSALQYLNDVNVPNPIFSPPANSCGHITYSFTVFNNCNESTSKNLKIRYNTANIQSSLIVQNIVNENTELSFDILAGACSQTIEIKVYSSIDSYSNPIYNEIAELSSSENSLHFSTDGILHLFSPCYDYKINIISTDICTGYQSLEEIDWLRDSNINVYMWTNFVTPNNDKINDCFMFGVSGAEQYHVWIANPGMPSTWIYNHSGFITQSPFTTWCPPICEYPILKTYMWVAEFWNSCGNYVDMMGSLGVYSGNCTKSLKTPDNFNVLDSSQVSKSANFSENNGYFLNINPNPFGNSSALILNISETTKVNIFIINSIGVNVLNIYNGILASGQHNIEINGTSLSSGVYFCVFETPTQREVVKIVKIE